MESSTEIIGNPITLLVERVAYLALGLFFIIAFYRAIKTEKSEGG